MANEGSAQAGAQVLGLESSPPLLPIWPLGHWHCYLCACWSELGWALSGCVVWRRMG